MCVNEYILLYIRDSVKLLLEVFFCRCVFLFVGDDGEQGYSYLYFCGGVFCVSMNIYCYEFGIQ